MGDGPSTTLAGTVMGSPLLHAAIVVLTVVAVVIGVSAPWSFLLVSTSLI